MRDSTTFGTSLAVIFMALVVLAGWHLHIPAAVQIFPGFVPMQYNSALCFLALGAGGLALASGRRTGLWLGGSFAAVMGGVVLLEYATGASFGIDTFFFYPWERALSADPGRMALPTAFSFFLTGSALVILAVRPHALAIFGIVTSVSVSLALTSLIGYAFQITYVLPFRLGTQMALHTSMAFLAYGIALMSYAWKSAERGRDGQPTWIAGMSVALLPVLFVGSTAFFPVQTWPIVLLEALLSIAGVALIAQTVMTLTTAKVAYKGLLLIVVPLVLLLTFVGLVAQVKNQNNSDQLLALHSAEVIGVSQSLLAQVAETESSARAYVITGDRAFAASFDASSGLVPVTASQLRNLVTDNPLQEGRARAIERLATERVDRLSWLVRLINGGNQLGAEDEVGDAAGPALMKQVREELGLFSREEDRVGAARRLALDASWQRLSWLLVAGTAGAILLAGMLTLSFSGGISRRLEQLRDNATSLAAGKALALPLTGHDEIAELDRVFHEMARSLDEVTRREKAVIEGATDGIIIKDLEHRYVMVNEGSAKLFGMKADDIVGKTVFDLFEPATAARLVELDDVVLASGTTTTMDIVATLKGEEPRTYASTYGPYRGPQGEIVGVFSITREVTDQRRAERALIESERRFRELFYDAPVGYHELDIDGRITCVNNTELSMLGYASEDMVGHHVWDFIEAAEQARTYFGEKMAGTRSLGSIERSFRRKDGSWVAMHLDEQMLKDQNGNRAGIRATLQDITERKRVEAMIKTGALQTAIFNSANFSSIATDASGVIQIFNVGAERMLGYAAADVTNTITPADISDPQELIARANALSAELGTPIKPGFEALVFKASRGIEDIYELTYIRKDGSRFPAVVSVTALRDADGAIIGYLLIGTDNTARQQVEEERKRLDQRLRDQHFYTRSLIESNIDALMAIDPRGIITDVNKQTEALTGCTRDELIGAPFKSCFTDAARAEDGINRVLAEGTVTNYELTARTRDGAETIVSYNATTFHDRDRRLQGVFAAARDVTELKLFELELRQKNLELEEASRMKSEFLANMSHELRTPLNAIIGFSEVLRDGLIGDLTDQQRGFIGDIFTSGRHLLSLINDILDLSKVEAGRMTLDVEAVPIESLFANGLSMIREKAVTRRVQVDLDLEAAKALGSIQADPRKIRQILYNLLANAVKFTHEGGEVKLRAARVARAHVAIDTPSGNWTSRTFALADSAFEEFLEIRVSDNGIGMSPEGLDRLFKPFSQIDSGLARRFEGTGLGLMMVKMLVELHGGSVAVESATGEGSCFTVWLPFRSASDAPVAAIPAVLPAVEPRAGVRTALVVEDDLKSAELIRMQLEAEGFRVLHAVSAETALALVVQQPVSLITLDVMLPHMDGWDFLARLKQVPDLRSIPVLIISIVADSSKGFALGAAAVMQKPTTRQELSAALIDVGLLPRAKDQALKVLVVDDDPAAVELMALRVTGLASTVLRAYGGREAIEAARCERPDLIVLDLMMPDVSGFDVVDALHTHPNTADIPILVVTAKQITPEDRRTLNGFVTTIMDKAEFDGARFTAEVRRAMSGRHAAA